MKSELAQQILNLREGDHLCLFYEKDPAEQIPALIPFIQDAFAHNEQFIYIADDHTVDELAACLRESGIDVALEIKQGRLKLWSRKEWRQPGELSSEKKAIQVREFMNQAVRDGYAGVRFAVEMTWTLGPDIDARQLEHWEATINTLFAPGTPGRIICQYNQSRLSPDVLLAGLHTHPLAILGDQVYPNPFYQAPLILGGNGHTNGHSPANGNGHGHGNGKSGRARVEWMIAQMKKARVAEEQRAELFRQRVVVQEAEHSRAQIEKILDSIGDGFVAVDPAWRFTYVNRAAEKLLGRPAAELARKNLRDEFAGLLGADAERACERAAAEQTSVEFEFFHEPQHRWFSVRIYPAAEGFSIYFRDATEKKHAADQLQEIQERFQAILDNSATVIYIKDTEGRYLQINNWFSRLFHVTPADIVGKTDFDLFPEQLARKFRENDRTVTETGRAIEIEEIAPHEDGARTYISNKFPLRKTDGTIYAIAGISTDITGRKAVEDAALRLAAIIESSDDAIISKDLNGVIMSWNNSAQRIFGYTAEEAIGRPVMILIPEDRHDEEPEILKRIRRGERVDHYETIRRHKDGRLVDISLTISPIKDPTGRIVGASKIARDITDRKRAERQQETLYQLVATVNRSKDLNEIYNHAVDAILRCQDASRAAILMADSDGVMRFKVSRKLSEDYRRAVEGHSPWRRDDPDPQPVCIDDVTTADMDERLRDVVRREGIRALAFIPLRNDQRLLGKCMLYYDAPHRFTPEEIQPAQTIAGQVVFAFERQKSGEALERLVGERTASLREAIAQMEEFSYSVSHDLRAPVRAMQGYARAVLEDFGDHLDPRGREYLDRIVRSGARMDRLIQDILIYSRVARGEIRLHPISVDKLVREIVQQYPLMQSPNAEVMVAVPLLEVTGHEPSLTQALSNLLSNAVKFVPPGTLPRVRVWTERRGEDVRVWIKDNGIGIRPEFQHRLFGMFERMHPEKNFEGTGIGLAIVRKAVERMGGQVGMESTGEGGSRFWIQLPAARNP